MGVEDHDTIANLSNLGIIKTADVPCSDPSPLTTLKQALGQERFALVVLFIAPCADFSVIDSQCEAVFGTTPVIGCTTAGEITHIGYAERNIVAIAFPETYFDATVNFIENVEQMDSQVVIDALIRNRAHMQNRHKEWNYEFNFLLVDGLSRQEDIITSKLSVGMGPVPLFGGSAADGVDFNKTYILYKGKRHTSAAVLTQFRTRCPIKVFKTDHLVPTDKRMVVTKANTENRVVSEINAAPAAREYARILGKDPEQLTPFTFAAHPVVVRIGGHHHVRAIQRIADNGDLVFFSAIDEGLVLTLAEPMHMVDHLREEFSKLSEHQKPDTILACDCILRRIEAQEKQMTGALSNVMKDNNVVGFSTYGEQYNSMHVNQTMTGVAIYPPKDMP